MRLLALAVILALAAVIGLVGDTAGAARKAPSRPSTPPKPPVIPPRPPIKPNPGIRPILPSGYPSGWRGLPAGYYRPGTRLPNGLRVANANINITFTFNSDAGKVRSLSPPEEFDDKGNLKKHTKEELLKLKGDDPAEKKMVGYKSDISEVQVGDVIQVSLSVFRTTGAAPKKKAKKDKDAEDDKDVKDDLGGEKKGKWVVAARLAGKVTRVDAANTDGGAKLTIQVTTQVLQGPGAPAVQNNQTVDPEKGQATLIIIGKRASAGLPKADKAG